MTTLLVLVVLLLLSWYLHFIWSHRQMISAAWRLPCPPTLPFLGNAVLFIGGVDRITKNGLKLFQQYKGIFCFWVGPLPFFLISDSTMARTVMNSSNTLQKDDFYNSFKPFLGNGIFTAPVPIWKKYRRLINPILHPANVKNFLPDFNAVSRQLCKDLGCGKLLDPRDKLFSATVDAILRTAVSESSVTHTTKLKMHVLFNKIGYLATVRSAKFWLHNDRIFYILYRKELKLLNKELAECSEEIQKGCQGVDKASSAKITQEINSEGSTRKNLLKIIKNHHDIENEDHKWKDEIHTMIMGGTDTVMTALSYVLVTLANHPEVQDRIRSEITNVMGDSSSDVSSAELDRLTYLECALLETLRLHSVAPVIFRRATKDIVLCNSTTSLTLPAGSRICVSLYAMHMNPERFPEPKKFLPERFMDSSKNFSDFFLPFSGGPRNCPGKHYGMNLMKTVMVHLLRKYQVTSPVKLKDIEYELKLVLVSKTPLLVLLKDINK